MLVENDEPGVDRDRTGGGHYVDGVGVAARSVVRFEDRDGMAVMQSPGGSQPGDSGSYYSDVYDPAASSTLVYGSGSTFGRGRCRFCCVLADHPVIRSMSITTAGPGGRFSAYWE